MYNYWKNQVLPIYLPICAYNLILNLPHYSIGLHYIVGYWWQVYFIHLIVFYLSLTLFSNIFYLYLIDFYLFCFSVYPAKTARLLILLSLPGHAIFVFAADFVYNGVSTVTPIFVLMYLLVGFIQLVILLYGCHLLVHTMWRYKNDPDNSAIPYLTAIGDLSGSGLLLLGFMLLRSINWEYKPVKWDYSKKLLIICPL